MPSHYISISLWWGILYVTCTRILLKPISFRDQWTWISDQMWKLYQAYHLGMSNPLTNTVTTESMCNHWRTYLLQYVPWQLLEKYTSVNLTLVKGARLTGPGVKSYWIPSRHSWASYTHCPTMFPTSPEGHSHQLSYSWQICAISCSWTMVHKAVAVMWPKGEKACFIITAQVLLQLIIFTPSFQSTWKKINKLRKCTFFWFCIEKMCTWASSESCSFICSHRHIKITIWANKCFHILWSAFWDATWKMSPYCFIC